MVTIALCSDIRNALGDELVYSIRIVIVRKKLARPWLRNIEGRIKLKT